MTYDVYMNIYNVGVVLTIIMFVVSLILFFVLKIPAVIGDLSGATARKAIENIRNQNEETGEKAYKSSSVNKERGKITDKISPSGNLHSKPSDKLGFGMRTEKISTQRLDNEDAGETTVLGGGNETTVLGGGNETTVLGYGNETTVLSSDLGETSVLNEAPAYNETTLLSPGMMSTPGAMNFGDTGELPPLPGFFEIEQDITFIHTQEIIPIG